VREDRRKGRVEGRKGSEGARTESSFDSLASKGGCDDGRAEDNVPSLHADKNFSFIIILPLKTPSTSIPAGVEAVSAGVVRRV
jgi:hypothetical protein